MSAAPRPPDEDRRLAALRRAKILDTEAERGFDTLVQLAARVCGTPMSLVSFVAEDRQWFKARVGIDATETPREVSFCAHALIKPNELLVIPDATLDARFAENPFVTGAPHVRFYAGAALMSVEGQPLGTLCVIDTKPRRLTEEQLQTLRSLALLAGDQLIMRANIEEMGRLLEDVKTLSGLIPVCAWCRQVRDDDGYWSCVEEYVQEHSDAKFTHGMCPDCAAKELAAVEVQDG